MKLYGFTFLAYIKGIPFYSYLGVFAYPQVITLHIDSNGTNVHPCG